ncbi:exonuclease domain-containing protein [Methylophaga sp. UBA678]|mgnify:FL=1|uniref:exonuclease domain-containing protein n=1 Tax=Methylophaga sp. UBA678 TaxID=1946901 RepID=UPI00259CBB72|nr:exonuclease domain-containing protein [Methylophaga sp. UBA678]
MSSIVHNAVVDIPVHPSRIMTKLTCFPEHMILLDCETTGGRASRDRITEIGLIEIKDGEVQSRWQSLINPGRPIPPWIHKITGIDDEMVADAPAFEDIAESLYQRLKNVILVAHNARFDYSFLKQEFKCAGYDYSAKTLCSVKLSRRLFPQHQGHSLDKIIQRHQIAVKDRHRAMADTEVILTYFTLIQQQIDAAVIQQTIADILKRPSLPSHLDNTLIQKLPEKPGIYQFYDEGGTLLYIGKSVNIKERVLSHFSADHRHHKELDISQQLHHIDWIETPSDFGAQLLENSYIKQTSPRYNRRQTKIKKLYQINKTLNKDGYAELDIMLADMRDASDITSKYGLFRSKKQAQTKLLDLISQYKLCQRLCHIEKKASGPCFSYQLKKCLGACCGKEQAKLYNLRVDMALTHIKNQQWPWSTPIIVEEQSPMNNGVDSHFHLIDQWCYLGQVDSHNTPNTRLLKQPQDSIFFDIDTYKILLRFLAPTKLSHFPYLRTHPLENSASVSMNSWG